MCGKNTDNIFIVKIEGVEMNVCKQCTMYGQFIRKVRQEPKLKETKREISIAPRKETIFVIDDKYGKKIKDAREKLGLKQEELAKKLNERESLIQKIESQHKEPSIDMARKLEKHLKIKLISQEEVSRKINKRDSRSKTGMTIGDMIKIIKK